MDCSWLSHLIQPHKHAPKTLSDTFLLSYFMCTTYLFQSHLFVSFLDLFWPLHYLGTDTLTLHLSPLFTCNCRNPQFFVSIYRWIEAPTPTEGPDGMSFTVLLAETGSGGACPKNVSAPRSHPQEMPVQPVGVCTDEKRGLLLEEFGFWQRKGWMAGVWIMWRLRLALCAFYSLD